MMCKADWFVGCWVAKTDFSSMFLLSRKVDWTPEESSNNTEEETSLLQRSIWSQSGASEAWWKTSSPSTPSPSIQRTGGEESFLVLPPVGLWMTCSFLRITVSKNIKRCSEQKLSVCFVSQARQDELFSSTELSLFPMYIVREHSGVRPWYASRKGLRECLEQVDRILGAMTNSWIHLGAGRWNKKPLWS